MQIGFICSTGTQVDTFLPVMHSISAIEETKCIWVSLDGYYKWDAEKTLEGHKLEYVSLKTQNFNQQFTKLSLPLMYWYLLTDIKKKILNLLNQETLDVLIFGNDRGLIEKLFIRLAKAHGVKTLLIQDGMIWSNEVRTFTLKSRFDNTIKILLKDVLKESLSWIMRKLNISYLAPSYLGQGKCDLIAVMGEAAKQNLVLRGIDPNQIIITGQPRYEYLIKSIGDVHELKKRLDITSNYLILSVFTSAFKNVMKSNASQQQQEDFIKKLINYIENYYPQKVRLFLKPHPRESVREYELLTKNRPWINIVREYSSLEIINLSSLIISVPSTIMAEACLMNKPLAIIKIGVKENIAQLVGLSPGSFKEFDNFDELAEFLDCFVSGRCVEEISTSKIYHKLVFSPGDSSYQLALLIRKLAKNEQNENSCYAG